MRVPSFLIENVAFWPVSSFLIEKVEFWQEMRIVISLISSFLIEKVEFRQKFGPCNESLQHYFQFYHEKQCLDIGMYSLMYLPFYIFEI